MFLQQIFALALSTVALAAPLNEKRDACASASGDAPFSLSCDQLASVITFPHGNQQKAGGIVFLVHGTGSTGEETWDIGPYTDVLPDLDPGYDIAWFTSPSRSLEDAQTTAEYIAYNIRQLAQQSSTGKVFVIGHSQGNINIQWALAFFPSTRDLVSGFISLAADFEGTTLGPVACLPQQLLLGGCGASVLQQSIGSNYLAAQNSAGGSALVPTTTISTLLDEIVRPQLVDSTSDLSGSANFVLQNVCPAYVTDHFGITIAEPAFFIAYDALRNGGRARASRFNALTQCGLVVRSQNSGLVLQSVAAARQLALDAIALVSAEKQRVEPPLRPYVCQRGAATQCAS